MPKDAPVRQVTVEKGRKKDKEILYPLRGPHQSDERLYPTNPSFPFSFYIHFLYTSSFREFHRIGLEGRRIIERKGLQSAADFGAPD